ncbi:hypothetical protein [Nonomuraea diastatica]|nr:hypothetical protein [Nonomuraea diastatica]
MIPVKDDVWTPHGTRTGDSYRSDHACLPSYDRTYVDPSDVA